MEGDNDHRSLYELAEAYRPVHEALRLAPFGHPSNELCDGILADIQQEECRARSTQERLLADSLLLSHLQNEKKPDMEMVCDVADRYRLRVPAGGGQESRVRGARAVPARRALPSRPAHELPGQAVRREQL